MGQRRHRHTNLPTDEHAYTYRNRHSNTHSDKYPNVYATLHGYRHTDAPSNPRWSRHMARPSIATKSVATGSDYTYAEAGDHRSKLPRASYRCFWLFHGISRFHAWRALQLAREGSE